MDFQRLIAFGCSNTFGKNLDDNFPLNEFPSNLAWPTILSDLFGVELINNGKSGASNKEILYTILNFDFKSNDIVFVLWTHADRHCIIHNKDEIERLGVWWANSLGKERKKNKTFFKIIHNEYDQKIQNFFFYNLASYYMHCKEINHVFLPLCKDYINNEDFLWDTTKFLNTFFLDIRAKNKLAQDKLHAGPKAHKIFANEVYQKFINSDYYIG